MERGRAMRAYPIKPTYHVRSYYFGERLIPDLLGKQDAPGGVVAETWEVSDYRETTGRVINGEYAGRTLHDLVVEFPDELVGEGWSGPHFPLLEKFLDASHMLPVHLHADDATAREKHGEPHGKTEAWHILRAGHPDLRGPADLGPRPVRHADRPLRRATRRGDLGREHKRRPRRAQDKLPAPPEPRPDPGGRRSPPRPLLRGSVLRPRALDLEGTAPRALPPGPLPYPLERWRPGANRV